MTFLPMVERELRVLARRPSTYRWRWIIGGTAFGLALLLLAFMGIGGGPQRWGQALFTTLMVYSAFVSVLAGLFGTVDLISEERREGTLGLLFLTDLKGYDVILGKFSAVALNAFYWLLAIVPVLAMPMLIGGVTFGEVTRVSLALFNLLFFTMAVGTWASVRSVEVYRSLSLAGLVLVLFGIVSPILFGFMNQGVGMENWAIFSGSPVLALAFSSSARYAMQPGVYWYALLSTQLLAWACLALAIWKVPNIWRQSASETGNFSSGTKARWRDATDFNQRAKWLDENPALFLMRPQRMIRLVVFTGTGLATLILLIEIFWIDGINIPFLPSLGSVTSWLILIPFKLLMTVHVCRFFSEARVSGIFELLLSTPLTTQEIVKAHWTILDRTFLGPLLLVSLYVGFGFMKGFMLGQWGGGTFAYLSFGYTLVSNIIDYYLLGWMGVWMALKCKKPGWASFLTILFALVLPTFVCWLGLLVKPVMMAIARHNVVYEFQRLIRRQYDEVSLEPQSPGAPMISPPPLN